MKNYVKNLGKLDWVSIASCVSLVALTLLPLLPGIGVTSDWLQSALISLAAVVLSAIVLAQIAIRGSGQKLDGRLDSLQTGFNERLDSLQSSVNSAIRLDAVHEVAAGEVGVVLDKMLEGAKEWYFRGGSARWQREAVLPKLALVKDQPVRYEVQIISPFEEELCNKYALYRKKSRPGDNRADPKQIRLELFAFLYATVVWSSRSKIDPNVTLLHRFSPFRLDGDSGSFVITVADPSRNALRAFAGNWYHTSLIDEFAFEAGYATALKLPPTAEDDNAGESVRAFFESLRDLNAEVAARWDGSLTDQDLEEIYELARTN